MSEEPENPISSGTILHESSAIPGLRPADTKPAGSLIVIALKISAWFNLIVCTVASFYIFRELGVRLISEEGFLDYTEKVVSPFGITLSLALFLQGIFGCIFFLAIASFLENMISIKKTLGDIKFLSSRETLK